MYSSNKKSYRLGVELLNYKSLGTIVGENNFFKGALNSLLNAKYTQGFTTLFKVKSQNSHTVESTEKRKNKNLFFPFLFSLPKNLQIPWDGLPQTLKSWATMNGVEHITYANTITIVWYTDLILALEILLWSGA